ncbi:MAG: hypothetical protein ACLQIQ_11610, partial [Beijerinckiaceae bacterium]
MSVTLDVSSGSVSVDLASSSSLNPSVSETVELSQGGIDLTTNIPAVMPVTASTGLYDWSDPAAWGDAYLAVQGAADVSTFVQGILSGEDISETCSAYVNSLMNFGPTDQSSFAIPITTTDFFVIPVNFNVAINLTYDVTIPDEASIFADQPNVDIYRLEIDAGGSLTAGSQSFVVDDYVMNAGQFTVDSGAGVTITGDLFNDGTTTISGNFTIDGAIYNDGTITAQSATFAIANSVDNLYGIIEALSSGTLNVTGTVTGGVVRTSSGGTVAVGIGGVLRDTELAGSGLDGTASEILVGGGTVTSGSDLQDVTLDAGASYTALEFNETALGGTIVNGGTLAAAPGGEFAIDGPVTLTGGGTMVIDGNIVAGRSLGSSTNLLHLTSGADRLFNVDNTIAGSGGTIRVDLTNESGGVIEADKAGQQFSVSSYQSGSINQGIFEATNSGTLGIGGTLENSGGLIQALSGGTVNVTGTITDGTVQTSSGGTVAVGIGGVLRDTELAG